MFQKLQTIICSGNYIKYRHLIKIYNKPDNFSELETEAIFGEKFEQIKDVTIGNMEITSDNYTDGLKKRLISIRKYDS